MTTTAPEWFHKAIATPYREGFTDVQGCPIHYLEWGDRGNPGLVLVHGGAAHVHWWTFLAPLFTHRYHVVALDLSGHGDSGRRERYSHSIWADEIAGVCAAVGFNGPPVVAGHSLGGMVTIQTAATYGDLLAGAIIIDASVRRPDPETEEGRRGRAFRSPGVYATVGEALEHFHLIPRQPVVNPWVIDHVARHSMHEVDGGWTWKFDPNLFNFTLVPMSDVLQSVRCRVGMIRAEHSAIVEPDTAEYMYELLGRHAPIVEVPEAYHHLILDRPLVFVGVLRALLADWAHSFPRRMPPGHLTD